MNFFKNNSKKIVAVICCIVLVLMTVGCAMGAEKANAQEESMFVVIEERDTACAGSPTILYHKDTKVMYAVSFGDSRGVTTVLVNPDGTPMLYEGD